MLGSSVHSLEYALNHNRPRWVSHVVPIPTERLPNRELFCEVVNCGKIVRSGQWMTWVKSMKTLPIGSAVVGAIELLVGVHEIPQTMVAVIDVLVSHIFSLVDSFPSHYFLAGLPFSLHFFSLSNWCCEVACWSKANGCVNRT